MSNRGKTKIQDWLDQNRGQVSGPAPAYGMLALGSGAFISVWLIQLEFSFLISSLPLLFAVAGIFGKARIAAPAIFILVMTVLYSQTRSDLALLTARLEPEKTWIGAVALLVYFICQSRYDGLTNWVYPPPRKTRRPVGALPDFDIEPEPRDAADCKPVEFWDALLWAAFGVVTAQSVLKVSEFVADSPIAGYMPFGMARVLICLLLGFVAIATIIAHFSIDRWKNLDRRSAAIYLRNIYWTWNSKESESLGRYLAKRNARS